MKAVYLLALLFWMPFSVLRAQQCTLGNCTDGFGEFRYQQGERYVGEFKEAKLHGFGVFYFANGERFSGEFKENKYSGWGTYIYKNGNIGKGIWNDLVITKTIASTLSGCTDGNCTEGIGTFRYNNEDEYRGAFVNSKRHGKGMYLFANGDMYIGYFIENRFEGRGIYVFQNGNIWDGYWTKDQFTKKYTDASKIGCVSGDCKDGHGVMVWANGSKYIGEFRNNKLEGEGTFITSNNERYVGRFANGRYNGYGTYYYMDGSSKAGQWKDNTYVGNTSTQSKGCIAGNCMDGYGTFVFNEGNRYTGTFKNGFMHGKGTYLFINGDKYEGNFESSKFNGQGTYTFANGTMQSGWWLNNVFKPGVNTNTTILPNTNQSATATSSTGTGRERRLALVIGNSNYLSAGFLKNPINDARGMEAALKEAGFDVMRYENISRDNMKRVIDDFGQRLTQYDVGLFFFAGHGLQMQGRNYLIPVNANIYAPRDVEYECVEADRVLAKMESARNRLNIVILDACRNNPFERSWNRSGSGSGLANMNAPVGSFIAYATAPGTTASDGEGANGLYTEQILKFMRTPGAKIEDVFKQVRINVMRLSNNEQTPWESSSLIGDFYFKR